MIESLHRLGKALQTDPEEYGDYFAPWENPFPRRKTDENYVVFYFDIKNDVVSAAELETFRPSWVGKYLYRKPKGSNGAPLVPTGYYYPATNEEKHADGVAKLLSRMSRAIPDGKSLYFSSTAAKEAALLEVERSLLVQPFYDANTKYLLTFKIEGKWLGEFKEFVTLFEEEAYAKYYEKSKAAGKTCALTYQDDVEVWGRVDTLGFTVNDVAFQRGGFTADYSYKMFPVSAEAVVALEGAKRFALEKLGRSFHNLRYLVLPRLLEGNDEDLLRVVKVLAKDDAEVGLEKQLKPILSSEMLLSRIARTKELSQAGMLYDILFYQQNQAQMALILHLQDINPSHLHKVLGTIDQVSNFYNPIARVETKKEVFDFRVTFSRIKDFFAELSGTDYVFQPYFYRIIEAVFYGEELDQSRIVSAFIDRIRKDFRQRHESESRFQIHTKQAFAIWHFFYQLGSFPGTNPQTMDAESTLSLHLNGFIEQHEAFFTNPMLRAAFLMGGFTNVLLSSQKAYLGGNIPFHQKLNNLNLDKKELIALFPQVVSKMAEYKKMEKLKGKSSELEEMQEEIVKILTSSANANRDEISFSFVSGMVMQREFEKKAYEEYKAKKEQAAAQA